MGKYEIFKNRTRFILKEPLYASREREKMDRDNDK